MTASGKKDSSTKKLIDNFANKVNSLIKNCEHPCEQCNAQ